MKYKTTRKAIVNGCANVKCAGFCDLQHLLKNHEPKAYTCGVYGWNFDVYEVYGVTICTGYRGMPGERLQGIEEYEHKAKTIGTPERVERLLQEFCILNRGAV
jgi:hypothetical protein